MSIHVDAGNEFLSICRYCGAVEVDMDEECPVDHQTKEKVWGFMAGLEAAMHFSHEYQNSCRNEFRCWDDEPTKHELLVESYKPVCPDDYAEQCEACGGYGSLHEQWCQSMGE